VATLLSNLPELILLGSLAGLVVYSGFRSGPRFLLTRLAGLVFVLVGVTFVTFILGYVTPGSAVDTLCGSKCTGARLDALNKEYGFNLPWYQQYGRFVNNLLHLNLGLSITQRGVEVWDLLKTAVPISVQLGLWALGLALVIGIPLGVLAAVRAGSRFDTTSMGLALVLFALPPFVTIPIFDLLMIFLSHHHLPYLSVFWDGQLLNWIAPVALLAALEMGFFARYARTTMLDVLHQDYVRTARAKGLTERVVVVRHAFRNALVPLVTAIGPTLAFVVAGAFFTETLFNIPGIGYQSVTSVANKDMPVLQGTVILIATAVAFMNLVVDILYGLLDPRIKAS
jgi:ABC-type dipeptide/oligopeptide/nickel transport system permease component